ncbi:MAG: D-alanine--D-alanine ligase [Spirochaetales bacterium]|nr:D-alanine--D-alanine ligase [Spirochaetales bacterium]
MKTIVILYGGRSGEHEVSLRSGGSIFTHLDRSLYTPILIGVDHEGIWYLQETPGFETDGKSLKLLKNKELIISVIPGKGLYCNNKKLETDLIFPVLHGTFGEDGTLQGLLEIAGIPYAGARVLGSAIGMDKAIAKQIWIEQELPVVPFKILVDDHSMISADSLKSIIDDFGFPLFIKPANAGSSLGVSKINSLRDLDRGIEEGFRYDTKLMIEPAITGREIECSVIGNDNHVSFIPGELISEDFYDYDSKYVHPENTELSIPADLTESQILSIQKIAEKAFSAAGIEGFARVDFFIEKKSGEIMLNEINTLPGFTEISMFAKLCSADGLSYKGMLTKIIGLAEERYAKREKLSFKKISKTVIVKLTN